MSNDDERTLVRRGNAYAAPRTEPTSWNGISYDDMMRSLEDALPPTDPRPTIADVQFAATRPTAFEPVPVTHRMPDRPAPRAEIVKLHTKLIPQQVHAQPQPVATVAPVALPMRYVDLDADVDVDLDAGNDPSPTVSTPRKRIPKGLVVGAALGMLIAVGGYAYVNPDARTSATATATGARARVSSWMAAAAPPPAVAPAAPPPVVSPVASPVAEDRAAAPAMTAAPSVPTMRAPAPPPHVRPAKAKRVDADDSKPAEIDPDPSSLLDRGLGN